MMPPPGPKKTARGFKGSRAVAGGFEVKAFKKQPAPNPWSEWFLGACCACFELANPNFPQRVRFLGGLALDLALALQGI